MPNRELQSIKFWRLDKSTKQQMYILVATFYVGASSVGQVNKYIGRTVEELHKFRTTVNHLKDDSTTNSLPEIQIKAKKVFENTAKYDEKVKKALDEFCAQIMKLPTDVLKDESVLDFFQQEPEATSEEELLKTIKTKSGVNTKGKELQTKSSPPNSPLSKTISPIVGECAYEEIPGEHFKPSLSSEYAEVTPTKPSDRQDHAYSQYAEVVLPRSTSSNSSSSNAVATHNQTSSVPDESQLLYALVSKPNAKTENQMTDKKVSSPESCLYEDASLLGNDLRPMTLTSPVPSSSSDNIPPPSEHNHPTKPLPTPPSSSLPSLPPRLPSVTGNLFYANSQQDDVQKNGEKPGGGTENQTAPTTPSTPVPPMPQFSAPSLSLPPAAIELLSATTQPGEIQVVSIDDYKCDAEGVLSFNKGTLASLILQSDSKWWCIKLGTVHGWVPSDYWRILNSGDCASLVTKGNSPWFIGKLNRDECSNLLMLHGKQQQFVVRESETSGKYAISVKYDDRIHHFPINVTPEKKYNIGNHNFKTVSNVISYYQKNPLFYDDKKQEVTLGSPLVILKH